MLAICSTFVLVLAACAPAAPLSPTAAPAKPAEAAKPAATAPPAKPPEAPTGKPAEAKPALSKAEGPAASLAAKSDAQPAEVKPAASPAAKPAEAKPALSKAEGPAASPAAKPTFDEKAVADFYRGKTVRIIVGSSAGGGFDLYSRLIAKHMGRHIPGNPTVIVENMPGGSFLVAMNHVARAAPKDGTVIGNVIGSLVLQQLFGAQGVEFDMTRLHYVGMPTPGTLVLAVTRASGISKVVDILGPNARQAIVGTTGPGAGNHDMGALMKEVLGANIKLVAGYPGLAQVKLGMESGELNAIFTPWETTKISDIDKVQSGDWQIIVQGTEQPHRDLPNVPTVLSLARNDEERQILNFGGVIPNLFEKVYLMPAEVPADRVAAMQDAFLKALADRELLADAEKAKQDINPVSGEEVRRRITEFMGMSPSLKAKLEAILKK
jgi:tripartite-type tricarboxylate transporter receptor subunit TctC